MDPVIVCSICDQALESATSHPVNVRQKGLNSLIAKSKQFGDFKWEIWSNNTSLIMHNSCRKWYLSATPKSVAARAAHLRISSKSSTAISSTSSTCFPASSSRSELSPTQSDFNFHELCLICGKPWDRSHKQGYLVQNDHMKQKLLDISEQRGDSVAIDVTSRLRGVESLTAVGARYHKKCKDGFAIPKAKKAGSISKAAQIDSAFQLVLEYIQNSPKGKFTLTELRNVMGDRCFSTPILYRKLKEFFGADIHILHQRGSDTLIFSITKLCVDWYRDPSSLLIWKMMRKVRSKTTMKHGKS